MPDSPSLARMETVPTARGWYADPEERFRYRFFDGTRWTAYAANDPQTVEWDQLDSAPPADVDPEPPVLKGLPIAFTGYFLGLGLGILSGVILRANGQPGGRIVTLIASQLGLWSGLVGACVVVSRRHGTGSLVRDFNWRFRKLDIGLGFAGAIAARLVSAAVVAPIPLPFRRPSTPDRSILDRVSETPLDWIVLLVIVVIGAPLIEELFFRGLLQPRIVELSGAARGLTITAVLFGAAHLTNWQGTLTFVYVIAIAGAGLVLGLMRYVSGRLGPPTWAHFFFNAQAMLATALLR